MWLWIYVHVICCLLWKWCSCRCQACKWRLYTVNVSPNMRKIYFENINVILIYWHIYFGHASVFYSLKMLSVNSQSPIFSAHNVYKGLDEDRRRKKFHSYCRFYSRLKQVVTVLSNPRGYSKTWDVNIYPLLNALFSPKRPFTSVL